MRGIFSGGSYANVTATLALIVALGGTSYAAVTLPRNSVDTTQIRNNAVTASKIKANAVTSGKVRDGALLRRDFKAGELSAGPAGPQGLVGPRGPAGAKGDKGDRGDAGASPVTRFARVNSSTELIAGSPGTTVAADPGEAAWTRVTFDRDVSSCTISSMAGAVDGSNTVITRQANAESMAFSAGSANEVRVIVTDTAGSFVTSSFHLLVYC